MASAFNADDFMSQEVVEPLETVYTPIPVSEYEEMVSDYDNWGIVKEITTKKGDIAHVFEVNFQIRDQLLADQRIHGADRRFDGTRHGRRSREMPPVRLRRLRQQTHRPPGVVRDDCTLSAERHGSNPGWHGDIGKDAVIRISM